MKIGVVTLFPELVEKFFETALIGRARENALLEAFVVNPRDFADPPHFRVDDAPYGGGAGMVMTPDPLCRAVESLESDLPNAERFILSPAGITFSQARAAEFSEQDSIILICGRYEGIDERVRECIGAHYLSVGPFVLMGGEIAAMSVIEATTRLIPGVLGNASSPAEESHVTPGVLEAPQYTRPPEYRGHKVPDVLLSGNHQEIAKWRSEQSARRSRKRQGATGLNTEDFESA